MRISSLPICETVCGILHKKGDKASQKNDTIFWPKSKIIKNEKVVTKQFSNFFWEFWKSKSKIFEIINIEIINIFEFSKIKNVNNLNVNNFENFRFRFFKIPKKVRKIFVTTFSFLIIFDFGQKIVSLFFDAVRAFFSRIPSTAPETRKLEIRSHHLTSRN